MINQEILDYKYSLMNKKKLQNNRQVLLVSSFRRYRHWNDSKKNIQLQNKTKA